MAQVTIYLPDKVAEEARKRAAQTAKSLSAYVAEIVARETTGAEWPKALLVLLERGEADLREPDDPPPEDLEPLT